MSKRIEVMATAMEDIRRQVAEIGKRIEALEGLPIQGGSSLRMKTIPSRLVGANGMVIDFKTGEFSLPQACLT